MINFRYHVVSIIAVFLALTVGIVMGTTVISESVVDRLEADARDFRARNGELRQEADRLEAQLGHYEQFGAALVPAMIRGRLQDRAVVVVVEQGVPGDVIERVDESLTTAGSRTPARIRLTDAWSLKDGTAREQLAAALGADANPADAPALLGRAAETLARRLIAGGSDDDGLRRLSDAGFLKLENLSDGTLPGAGSLIVYLSAPSADAVPNDQTFTIPLLDALTPHPASVPVVVAEPLEVEDSIVERIRGIEELGRSIATVDHADTWPGILSLIWSLSRGAGAPVVHYGVRRGASAIAPEPAAGSTAAPSPAPTS